MVHTVNKAMEYIGLSSLIKYTIAANSRRAISRINYSEVCATLE